MLLFAVVSEDVVITKCILSVSCYKQMSVCVFYSMAKKCGTALFFVPEIIFTLKCKQCHFLYYDYVPNTFLHRIIPPPQRLC
jgi:hypothetical protein